MYVNFKLLFMTSLDIFKDDIKGTYEDSVELIINKFSHNQKERTSFAHIENCIFKKGLTIKCTNPISQLLNIIFKDCQIETLSTPFIKSKQIRIYIVDCVVSGFHHSSGNLNELEISNSFGNFQIFNLNSIKISYNEESLFVDRWNKKSPKDEILSIKTSYFIKDTKKINIYSNEIKESFAKKLIDSRSIKQFGKYENFYIHNGGHKSLPNLKYLLSKEDKDKLDITISLVYSTGIEHHQTKVTGGYFKALSLKGASSGEISIEDIKVNNIFIHNFSSNGIFKLMSIRPISFNKSIDSKFEINSSILDNTWFYGVEFNNFKKISFFKSSFANTKISSCTFPNVTNLNNQIQSLKNIHYLNEKSSLFYREQYDLFLELKNALIKGGNLYEAQKMKSVALSSLEKVKGLKFWDDKFLLILNKYSNNHGVSPLRAFKWIFIIVVFFHTLNILSYQSIYFDLFSKDTVDVIGEYIQYIFVIANPTHKISNLVPKMTELTIGTYAISFFSRIFIGYIYYQFVASFRRFGKG
jgi:hypothetical protein